jgi:hypothetical protein
VSPSRDENRGSQERGDMTRIGWERLAALGGLAFVVLYVADGTRRPAASR